MKMLLEMEKADLRYNEETNAIELIWKKRHDEETYKTAFTKGLEFIEEYKATGWLSDIRNEGIVSPANSQWMQEEILPKAINLGLKRIAAVLKADVFQEFYVKNVTKQAQKSNQLMKYFDNIEDANKWLTSI